MKGVYSDMNESKIHGDILNSLGNLQELIKLANQGRRLLYIPIAVELRKLLCDIYRGKDNSLLTKRFSNVELHPIIFDDELKKWIAADGKLAEHRLIAMFTGQFSTTIGEGVSGFILFDETQSPLGLQKWLNQKILFLTNIEGDSGFISIRELIRSVADKEGAHADDNYDATLRMTKSAKLYHRQKQEDTHVQYIIAIGTYILSWIKKRLALIKE